MKDNNYMGVLKEIKDICDADFWGGPHLSIKTESANYFLLLGINTTTAFYSTQFTIFLKKKTEDKSKFSTETGVRHLRISKIFFCVS